MFRNIESIYDGDLAIHSLGELPPPTSVKMTDYEVAFTVSPDPQGLPKSFKQQYKGTLPLLTKYLSKFSDWYMTVESTLQGNIHFHGALKIRHKGEYVKYLRKIKSELGNTLPKYMDDPIKWYIYCLKDVKDMEETYQLSMALKGDYKKE